MFDKKYLARTAAVVFGILAAVAILLYEGSHFVERFSSRLELADAKITTVTETVTADAYIMRTEIPIIPSVSGGSVVPERHDGAHVHSGEKLAEIYSKASPDDESRLDEIDEQIALFEKNKEEDRSVQSTLGIEKTIYDTIGEIRSKAESGNYADALSLRTPLLVEIKKRAILTGEITDYDAQISRLTQEKNRLRSDLGSCLETLYAGQAGYYFSTCDGYGNVFSPSKIDSMTYDDFTKMTASEPEPVVGAAGITVTDYNWYIAASVKKKDAAEIESAGYCDVLFTYSGVHLSMDVERMIPESGGEHAVLILRSGKIPSGFDFTRMQPVEICVRSFTGFELPKSAVRIVDGHEGVFVMDEVTVQFRRINTIRDGENTIICTGEPTDDIEIINENSAVAETDGNTAEPAEYGWIKQNDTVIVSGTELHVGKVVG